MFEDDCIWISGFDSIKVQMYNTYSTLDRAFKEDRRQGLITLMVDPFSAGELQEPAIPSGNDNGLLTSVSDITPLNAVQQVHDNGMDLPMPVANTAFLNAAVVITANSDSAVLPPMPEF
ncbi:hypothetical protein D9619_013768 [Psilocybe cf. subviscida]|uniref:Uncharacterized protein n=1 Tax=Psilocybe cf. subviscida TaxID=2480587 RepID=A0A8H5BH92_9AGAR|nr:hypothetical protein D9619_013768 [Psilocybe cf. subviscida]